jgi:hypothetical protein
LFSFVAGLDPTIHLFRKEGSPAIGLLWTGIDGPVMTKWRRDG